MKGFFFSTPKKEYFFVTDKTRKTKGLVDKIDNILKEKECSHGKYYNIHGEGWGGFGHFLNENKTEIIYLE